MILSETRRDVLAELINVGLGHAAGAINEMIHLPIKLGVPDVKLLLPKETELYFASRFGERVTTVGLHFEGGFDGTATLLFPADSAGKLVAALHGVSFDPAQGALSLPAEADLDDDLKEIGNILVNRVLGTVANSLGQRLTCSVPFSSDQTVHELIEDQARGATQEMLVATTEFRIEHLRVDGWVTLLFQVASVERLMAAVDEVSFGG